MNRYLAILLAALLFSGFAATPTHAGKTNYDYLELTPVANVDSYSLECNDTSGNVLFSVDSAGDVVLGETGGSSADPDLSVAGYAAYAGDLEVVGDLLFNDGDEIGFSIDLAANVLRILGSSVYTSLRDTNVMLCTTATVTVAVATLDHSNVAAVVNFGSASSTTGSKVSVFDGGSDNKPGALALYKDDGTVVWLFASTAGALRTHTAYPTDDDTDGSALGTFNTAVDVDLSATGGSTGDPDLSVAGYAQFNGTAEFNGAIDADSTMSCDGEATFGANVLSDTADTDQVGTFTVPWLAVVAQEGGFDRIGDATDGTNAMAISDTGVVSFDQTPTGTDLNFSGTLYADKLFADTIEDEAGTGAPTFSHGADVTGDVDASGTVECNALEADTVTDEAGTGAPAFTFGLSSGANIVSDTTGTDQLGTFSVTWAAIVGDEVNADTIGDATDGTDAITIADSGQCTFPQPATFNGDVLFDAGAGGTDLSIGDAADTTQSTLKIYDGGADNKPGAIGLASDDGTVYYIFVDTSGDLRIHNAYPTDDDSDGSVVGAQS